jgi:hypothetical protein
MARVTYRFGSRTGSGSSPRAWIALCLAISLITISLAGCIVVVDDRHDDPPPTFVAEISSDVEADGDIAFTAPSTYTISSALGAGDVLAGIDPASGDEFRGFLDFPLRESHGVPLDAAIESATLEIYISSVSVSSDDRNLPFIIDLVAFQPPTLHVDDFDREVQSPLLTMPFDFYSTDAGATVVIDVTALMIEAQSEGLPDFQLRFLLDFSATSGLIEIDDSDLQTAPYLTVTYS